MHIFGRPEQKLKRHDVAVQVPVSNAHTGQPDDRSVQEFLAAKGNRDVLQMQEGRHSVNFLGSLRLPPTLLVMSFKCRSGAMAPLCAAIKALNQAENRASYGRDVEVIITPGRDTNLIAASGRSVRVLPSKS